jgi:hypothetical protein
MTQDGGATPADPEGSSLDGVARDASTILDVVNAFEAQGFTGQFAAREDGEVECIACHHRIDLAITNVDGFRRLEGASDPDDMLAAIALTCPRCRARGTLIVAYGPMSSPEDAAVLEHLSSAPPPEPGSVQT